jgi:hypothetical protein
MTWNYRVVKRGVQFAIHEVFYRDDGTVQGYSAEPVYPRAESTEDLAAELARYAEALNKPVLQYDELG